MEECLRKNEVSPTNHKDMKNYKTSEKLFSGPVLQLKQRFRTEVVNYNDIYNGLYLKEGVYEKINVFSPGIYKFLKNFLSIYLAKYGNHRNSFIFFLLKSYVAKANVNQNP